MGKKNPQKTKNHHQQKNTTNKKPHKQSISSPLFTRVSSADPEPNKHTSHHYLCNTKMFPEYRLYMNFQMLISCYCTVKDIFKMFDLGSSMRHWPKISRLLPFYFKEHPVRNTAQRQSFRRTPLLLNLTHLSSSSSSCDYSPCPNPSFTEFTKHIISMITIYFLLNYKLWGRGPCLSSSVKERRFGLFFFFFKRNNFFMIIFLLRRDSSI